MFRFLMHTAIATLLAFASTPAARAQCAPIPNTGCPGAAAPACSSAPRIGTRFSVQCPACRPLSSFSVIGTPMRAPIVIGAPLTCRDARCGAGCDPLLVLWPSDLVGLAIPNNARLIGLDLCVQCGCLDLARPPCITLSQATKITIQR